MRIGFVAVYSWRPHVEHLHYLAGLVREDGHHVEFLTCDADLTACYTRELRAVRPDWQECLMCRLGGLRSFETKNISSIGSYSRNRSPAPAGAVDGALSSASTLGRFESPDDYASEEFNDIVVRLQANVEKAYNAALAWIDDKRLDALVIFNGRMDATRAIFEAGADRKIPVATVERTWFGDGLQILPGESCLGLQSVNKLVSDWSDKPLTLIQAQKAASYISSRFLSRNQNEWRAYNSNGDIREWPSTLGRHRILLIPGSVNEIWGHPDWVSEWSHPTDAYDSIIDHFKLDPTDLVLRCHPNWGEKIGKNDGRRSEEYYVDWARKRGIHSIASTDRTSTVGLIAQSETVVIGAGSAGLEAGALGKQIIGISPSIYQHAAMRENAYDPEQLKLLCLRSSKSETEQRSAEDKVRRQTLRFAYAITHRVAQYVDYVKCVDPTRYVYKAGADPRRLIDMLTRNELTADDEEFSPSDSEESLVLDMMRQLRWSELIREYDVSAEFASIQRRKPFAFVDLIRNRMQRGDR